MVDVSKLISNDEISMDIPVIEVNWDEIFNLYSGVHRWVRKNEENWILKLANWFKVLTYRFLSKKIIMIYFEKEELDLLAIICFIVQMT